MISLSQRPIPTEDSTTQKQRQTSMLLSGIRTHDISDQAIRVYVSDCLATEIYNGTLLLRLNCHSANKL
jgi:hypothetical protein